ncbi:MAG: hypothetical protein RL681_102 [Candidatus Parcubacteria bacterium]|jgi:mannose-1-phosphate guanylyltransferase
MDEKANKNPITQAIILSAGLGTRLRSVTGDAVPKVMVPLGGKPLLEHHIEQFKKFGVNELFINLFYLPEKITDYFGDGSKWNVKITYVKEEPEIRGTAGGVKNFDGMVHGDFFVIYGDMFSRLDYGRMAAEFAERPGHIGMMLIGETDHPQDSDLVEVDDALNFKKLYLKPHARNLPDTRMSFLATYIFNERIMRYIPPKRYYEIDHQILPDILMKGERFSGYLSDDYILDIGTPERYNAVEEYLNDGRFRFIS